MAWTVENEQLINTEFIDMPSFESPYPDVLWRVDSMANDGYPYHALLPDIEVKGPGAFCHAEKLIKVSIPESVKKIGAEAFRYTALRRVKIAADCEFYPTSFPEGCEISYYGGGGPYVPLLDKNSYTLIDNSGAKITVRSD